MSDLNLIRQASDAAPHRLYGPIATLVQDALAHAENLAGFALIPDAIKLGGTAEREINGGVALAKAVLAMPPLGVSGEDRSEPTPAPREPRRWPLHSPEPQEDGLVVRSTHTGVRFRYRASWGSWVALPPEGDDREHTWYAMNHPLGRGAAELVEELSEVVSPEGTS